MFVTLFQPKPVAKGKGCTERHCVPSSDGPRRRQEEEVDGEKEGREQVEGEIGYERKLSKFGNDEIFVNLARTRISHDCHAEIRPLTDLRLQYSIAMSTSRGVVQVDSRFLARNSVWEEVMSAKEPKVKVTVARLRPRMVRY